MPWPANAKSQLIGKDTVAGEDRRQKKRVTEDEMLDSITNSMDMNLGKHQEGVRGREAWCAAVHGAAKTWAQLSS